jgi:hypothetical protein
MGAFGPLYPAEVVEGSDLVCVGADADSLRE